ncbi:MAG: DeoR/GlpR transcriptional regulator [Acholeplasma sp.]|jgi:DeoR/GlpR family transcriptional regulator of sugar metabolism|nr:MAG: DeoR/GlpR transcriptional regulator [Acholeplasma sp.]
MRNSKAAIEKRRERILKLLEFRDTMTVEELAEELKTSEITIRRDLDHFEEQNLIDRHRGGASLNKNNFTTNIFSSNLAINKHAIAKAAARFVEDGDTIFINTSSTALLMLEYITAKQVTVVTNNGRAIFCESKDNLFVVLTGGELRMPKESLVGDFAINNLNRVKASKCFLGCSGISVRGGFTTAVLQEVAVNEIMLRNTIGLKFVLADTNKVGREHSFISGSISDLNYLVTDTQANELEIKALRSAGLKVIQVPIE